MDSTPQPPAPLPSGTGKGIILCLGNLAALGKQIALSCSWFNQALQKQQRECSEPASISVPLPERCQGAVTLLGATCRLAALLPTGLSEARSELGPWGRQLQASRSATTGFGGAAQRGTGTLELTLGHSHMRGEPAAPSRALIPAS